VRLRYLIARYERHAPYWQFVIWARQLSLAAVHEAFTMTVGGAVLEAAAALGVLGVALALHVRTRPYAHAYQNTLETVLAASSMGFVAVALAWALHEDHVRVTLVELSTSRLETLERSMLGVLLGPAVVYLTWLGTRMNHRRRVTSSRCVVEPLIDPDEVLLPSGEQSANDGPPVASRGEGTARPSNEE
jgi:hypothetical protein